jgi:hypothetical protein
MGEALDMDAADTSETGFVSEEDARGLKMCACAVAALALDLPLLAAGEVEGFNYTGVEDALGLTGGAENILIKENDEWLSTDTGMRLRPLYTWAEISYRLEKYWDLNDE